MIEHMHVCMYVYVYAVAERYAEGARENGGSEQPDREGVIEHMHVCICMCMYMLQSDLQKAHEKMADQSSLMIGRMYVCMYMYVCAATEQFVADIHDYSSISTHTFTYAYLCTHTHTHTYKCSTVKMTLHPYMYLYILTYTYSHTHAYTNAARSRWRQW